MVYSNREARECLAELNGTLNGTWTYACCFEVVYVYVGSGFKYWNYYYYCYYYYYFFPPFFLYQSHSVTLTCVDRDSYQSRLGLTTLQSTGKYLMDKPSNISQLTKE